ncbi:MAG: hypothetical protein Q9M08_01550 [Mariprofundus sp.]|nr:hypothetical protein [Mariprofundus sp.]
MRIMLLLFTLFAFSLPASAASVEGRSVALTAQLEGNNNYHAHLARELASIAETEKWQHDVNTAKAFINMAEKHAAKAGGAK